MKYPKKRKKIISIDKDTGEQIDGVIVLCGVKINPYAGGWIVNSQEALKLLAVDKDLTGETYKVLLYLFSILDFENWIQIPQTEIAKELHIHRQHVNRAIKKLESKEILLKGPKLGRSYSFRLNPNFGWKGKPINLEKYRQEKEREKLEKLKNKFDKGKNRRLKILSEEYNIPLDKIEKFLAENTEVE